MIIEGSKFYCIFTLRMAIPDARGKLAEFKDLAKEFEKEGNIILGVSKDNVKSHHKF